ncbi:MAG: class I SAM-dependent methyltransferase family protein [Candidatus Thorarchaeota archaeon]|nr:MAG: class I SAM-dependent methyltransferase family protein [Candidatus Thorarchaeota archaeon]
MSTKKQYVRVRREQGEETRQLLVASKLLDLDYKIVKEQGFLYFPLLSEVDRPSVDEALNGHEFKAGFREFQPTQVGPRTLEEALKDKMPSEKLELLPRAYDLIGDIAVLEIPEELEVYVTEIGLAFQRIHRNFSTVLAKQGAISGLTRTREYAVLAGENKTKTIHTEYGVRIAVDLAVAYFSPRLLEEHNRVAEQVQSRESVLDMFTGVGPFALHIAKKRVSHVVAVDINANAIKLLKESMDLNPLVGTIEPVVSDAHEYVRELSPAAMDRVIMNHPSGASDFIADACHVLKPGGIIHYYDFLGGEDPEGQLRKKTVELVKAAGREIEQIPMIRRVRDSAPYEHQMVADLIIS